MEDDKKPVDVVVEPSPEPEPEHEPEPEPVSVCCCSLDARQRGDDRRRQLAVDAELKRCGAV